MKKTIEGYLAEIDKRAPQKVDKEPVRDEKTGMVPVIEPKVFNFEAAESEVNEPELVEPELVEPEVVEPEVVEPEVCGTGSCRAKARTATIDRDKNSFTGNR